MLLRHVLQFPLGEAVPVNQVVPIEIHGDDAGYMHGTRKQYTIISWRSAVAEGTTADVQLLLRALISSSRAPLAMRTSRKNPAENMMAT